jgi:hypothetical protein
MAKNVLTLLISTAATYLLLELVAFRLLLPLTPLRLQPYLPDGIEILAQSSKRGTIPKDYVALTGDSYAQGLGDWLRGADPNRNPPFHSAHVLHQLSGRDVITFGRGGAGAVRGAFARPVKALRYFELSRLYAVDDPTNLIIYFYEGNDLADTNTELMNLRLLAERPNSSVSERRSLVWAYIAQRYQDPQAYLRGFEADGLWKKPDVLRGLMVDYLRDVPPELPESGRIPISDELYFARFIRSAFSKGLRHPFLSNEKMGMKEWQGFDYSETQAEVSVSGRSVSIPSLLQTPALELTPVEVEAALATFDQALGLLRSHLPTTEVCIVQVPSPASTYQFLSDEIIPDGLVAKDTRRFSVAEVRERSLELAGRLSEIAARQGSRFVDAGPRLRGRAKDVLVHGPVDWRHFNREGYTALAEAALDCL